MAFSIMSMHPDPQKSSVVYILIVETFPTSSLVSCKEDMTERTDFVPSHKGDNILPADPLFTRLLYMAHLPGQTCGNSGHRKWSGEDAWSASE